MCVCVCVCVRVCVGIPRVCMSVYMCLSLVGVALSSWRPGAQAVYIRMDCLFACIPHNYVRWCHLSLSPSVCVCVSDDDDEEEHLDWLATVPETDEPEEAGWGQLEVSSTEDAGIQPFHSTISINHFN